MQTLYSIPQIRNVIKGSFVTPSPSRPLRYKTQYCFSPSFVLLCSLVTFSLKWSAARYVLACIWCRTGCVASMVIPVIRLISYRLYRPPLEVGTVGCSGSQVFLGLYGKPTSNMYVKQNWYGIWSKIQLLITTPFSGMYFKLIRRDVFGTQLRIIGNCEAVSA